ncbi:trypco2 family protein [Roseiconus lacunae]|uniref:trypco2 family protein n=1 Tax=Roseiconus lacunae TaxID=2605694 RepID=UPI0011F3C21B|nr:trypco2 family protein [Roseiconus lacunae]
MSNIELSDMIVGLRKEIQEAQIKAESESLRFRIESVDVEAQVAVSIEAGVEGSAKWKFWILSEAEGKLDAGVSEENLQTIRLRLIPVLDGGPIEVARIGHKPD